MFDIRNSWETIHHTEMMAKDQIQKILIWMSTEDRIAVKK